MNGTDWKRADLTQGPRCGSQQESTDYPARTPGDDLQCAEESHCRVVRSAAYPHFFSHIAADLPIVSGGEKPEYNLLTCPGRDSNPGSDLPRALRDDGFPRGSPLGKLSSLGDPTHHVTPIGFLLFGGYFTIFFKL